MLAFGVATLTVTPRGGVAADRFPKRTVLLVVVAMLIVSSLLTGLAVVTGVIRLLDAGGKPAPSKRPRSRRYLPARIAFIAEVVEPEQIGPAVMLSQTAQEAMRVVAPALAGVLIGLSWFGAGGVFLLSPPARARSARSCCSASRPVPPRTVTDALADRRDGRRVPLRAAGDTRSAWLP